MCGIAGIGGLADRERVQKMTRTLIHRGPDSEGYYVSEGVSLGMRRLKIIDLATGDQPISNEDEGIWTVLNGEIYNYVELRRELEAKGHRFKTQSDTEVLVHLYEEKGEAFLSDLRGMFSLAIWDEPHKKLILARDRFGIKPLYYSLYRGALYFASEIKGILEVPGISRELDPQALLSYLNFLYIPQPQSIFESIRKLPPAHYGIFQKGEWKIRSYWNLKERPPLRIRLADAKEQYLEILREAVTQHLRADVPWGIFLSGGVDSSSVAAMVRQISTQTVHTFNIAFPEEGFSEAADAQKIARHLGTQHHEFVLDSASTWILPEITRFFDEPFADTSAIPTYYVSQMARTQVTVALSGEGGDDTLSGYGWHHDVCQAAGWGDLGMRALLRPFSAQLARKVSEEEGYHAWPDRCSRFLLDLASELPDICYRKMTVHGARGLSNMLHIKLRRFLFASDPVRKNFTEQFMDRLPQASTLTRLLALEVAQPMMDDLLVKVDRMSMAHSLEVRVPLLDHKLVEFAFSLPDAYKLQGRRTKVILREAMKKFLPASLFQKRKQGFSIPISAWLREGWKEPAQKLLEDPHSRLYQFLHPEAVSQRWCEHQDGRKDWGYHLWSLVTLEEWLRKYQK